MGTRKYKRKSIKKPVKHRKTRKQRKIGKPKHRKGLRLYGGVTANPITRDRSESGIEAEFNPDGQWGWKWPTCDPNQNPPYNCAPLINGQTHFPILFSSLPEQSDDHTLRIYQPLYRYILDPNINELINPINPQMNQLIVILNNHLLAHDLNICLRIANNTTCPYTGSRLRHAFRSCCGFSAPILGFMMAYGYYCLQNPNYVQPYSEDVIRQAAIGWFQDVAGYNNSPISWNRPGCEVFLLRGNFQIPDGVNVLTIYDRHGDCGSSLHHFTVIKYGAYSIIVDSWAGQGGHRDEWVRIMRTNDLVNLFQMLITSTNITQTNILFGAYFIVPHNIYIRNNIDLNRMPLVDIIMMSFNNNNHSAIRTVVIPALERQNRISTSTPTP